MGGGQGNARRLTRTNAAQRRKLLVFVNSCVRGLHRHLEDGRLLPPVQQHCHQCSSTACTAVSLGKRRNSLISPRRSRRNEGKLFCFTGSGEEAGTGEQNG